MLCRIAAHVADPDRNALPHRYYSQLRDGVLLEVLAHKVHGVVHRQRVPVGQEIFLRHCKRHVQHQHQVADDAALQRRRVAQQPPSLLGLEQIAHRQAAVGALEDGVPAPLDVLPCRLGPSATLVPVALPLASVMSGLALCNGSGLVRVAAARRHLVVGEVIVAAVLDIFTI